MPLVNRQELVRTISLLSEENFDVILIGSSVFSLYRKSNEIGEDIDFFSISPDPLIEEEEYLVLAEKQGWELERSWIDTPVLVTGSGVRIEFYSNMMEFEFPMEFLDELKEWKIGNVRFKSVNLEQALLLKARAALVSDVHKKALESLISDKKLSFDKERLARYLGYFSEETRNVMKRVLKETGLVIE